MKVSLYCFSILFISIITSCNNVEKTIPNTISIEILGTNQPDSLQVLNYNQSESIVLKHTENPYVFLQKNGINDAFKINIYKNGKTYSKKVFLDGESITIKAELNNEAIKIDTVIGSETYYKAMEFYSGLDGLERKQVKDSTVNQFLLEGVKENLNHPFSFEISNYYLERNQNFKPKLIQLKAILDKQPEVLKSHALSVHRTLEDLVKSEHINLSKFEFYNKNGKIAKIDRSHNGDYLLDFWFVQCPPCARDHKKIVKHLDLFSTNNVDFIGISIDTESDKWLSYLEKNNYDWKNYRELRKGNDLVDAMNVWEFPTYILVDNTGEIITRFYAFEDIENYYAKP